MKKLSFFLMAMLMSVMSFAAEYTILFKSAGSDSNTDLGADPTVSSVVSEGTSYVASFSGCAKIYVGVKGIKLGSSKAAGTLNFNLATLCQENVKSIKVVSAKYGSDTGTLTLAVNGTNVKTGITPGTDYTHTYNAPTKVESIKLNTYSKRAYLTKVIITTEEEADPNAVYYTITTAVNDATMGKAEGGGEYKENTKISLTATPNSGYEFVKWSNESTANPLEVTVTENATYTAIFQEQTPITCSQIKDLAIGDAFVLGEFTVTYVNGSYTYIKDATGASLIYASNYGLKAGDVVTGLAGTRANYNGLVQITPSVTKAQLTVTAGTAPQPEVATANPTQADMNKYVKYEQVTFDATAFASKKINATLAGQTTKFAVYDQWSTSKTFITGATYALTAAVSYYNAVQVNFISAVKVSLTISATANGGTVTGTGEFMEGDEVTLIATPNEGYEFVNWTWGPEEMCRTAEYTFIVEEDMNLVANFKKIEYTVAATASEGGTVEGLAEGGKYEHGATATLTATANEGYEFVCWTEGADTVSTEAEYGFEVLADRNLVANFVEAAPEINYDEFIMSNLVVTTLAEGLEMLEASDPFSGISVQLGVYEDGTLHEDCLITFKGTELSIVSSEKVTKEYNEDVETDVYTVRVVVAFGGENMGLQLLMYATAAAEPIIINVEGATLTLTEYQISAEETAYELNMISNWVYEEDGLTYEVECLLPTFDPTKESGDYEASFFVRGEGNAFGMTEDAIVSVAKNGNQITLTGEITAYNSNVYNVTISGTLPSNPTALDKVEVSASAVKVIENGQLIVIKNGVKYNALGQVIK